MTEKELRQMVADKALSLVGLNEADGSHRQIIDVYNAISPLPAGYKMSYTDPWCAAFVSALGQMCSLTSIILPECSCDRMIALYKAAGRWEEMDFAVPHIGDLILYDWDDSGEGDCTGEADHVGVIVSILGNLLKVVEGNKSDAVGCRTVYIDAPCIRGYCQPDYASVAQEEPYTKPAASAAAPASPAQSAAPQSCTLTLPWLSDGSAGETVKAAQLLLIGRGYRCGPCGADGEFGSGTSGGVLRFQRGRQLEADSIIGPETWSALLGLQM